MTLSQTKTNRLLILIPVAVACLGATLTNLVSGVIGRVPFIILFSLIVAYLIIAVERKIKK